MFRKETVNFFARSFLLSMSIFAAGAANAEAAKQFEFRVIEGYQSSTAVLEGNYQDAIELARVKHKAGTPYDRAVNATSLCVAYAKMANVEEALDACTKAVRVSRRVRTPSNIDEVARNNRNIVRLFAKNSAR